MMTNNIFSVPFDSNVFIFSIENFMKIFERDAEDRRKRRIEKEKKANGVWFSFPHSCCWRRTVFCTCCSAGLLSFLIYVCIPAAFKDKGNEAFAQEDYESAVKYYSDGLAELPDMQHLYTNRAQVNIFNLSFSSFRMYHNENTNGGFEKKLITVFLCACHHDHVMKHMLLLTHLVTSMTLSVGDSGRLSPVRHQLIVIVCRHLSWLDTSFWPSPALLVYRPASMPLMCEQGMLVKGNTHKLEYELVTWRLIWVFWSLVEIIRESGQTKSSRLSNIAIHENIVPNI